MQTNRTRKTNVQKGGVNIGEVMSFASKKTKILELVDTLGRMKPSNFGHMISLKQRRLVKLNLSPHLQSYWLKTGRKKTRAAHSVLRLEQALTLWLSWLF